MLMCWQTGSLSRIQPKRTAPVQNILRSIPKIYAFRRASTRPSKTMPTPTPVVCRVMCCVYALCRYIKQKASLNVMRKKIDTLVINICHQEFSSYLDGRSSFGWTFLPFAYTSRRISLEFGRETHPKHQIEDHQQWFQARHCNDSFHEFAHRSAGFTFSPAVKSNRRLMRGRNKTTRIHF